MSSLTEQERLGLDDVFLSISSGRHKQKKWSDIKSYLQDMIGQTKVGKKMFQPVKILFHVQKRIKSSDLLQKLSRKRKKKRELRK